LSKVENDFRLIKNRLRMRYFLVFTICMFWMAGVHAQSPAAAKTLPAPAIKEPPQANNRPVLEVDEWWDEEDDQKPLCHSEPTYGDGKSCMYEQTYAAPDNFSFLQIKP
jgi:hypothetical protein